MTATAVRRVPSLVETMPAGTQAKIIVRVLASRVKVSSMLLPQLAHDFDVPLSGLQALLNHYGYPDRDLMTRHARTLTGQAPAATDTARDSGRPSMRSVPLGDLHPDPDNLRGNAKDDVEDLAASIQATGLLQPIVARQDPDTGRLVIVAGHRRHAALTRLQWTHVDVIVRAPMRPDQVLAAMLIENGQRRDLDPIEEARGINRLKQLHGWTDVQVATKIGRSQSLVSNRLALLDLAPHQQDELRTGELGLTAAQQLSRLQSGKSKPARKSSPTSYFGPTNSLSAQAHARCQAMKHKARVNGGMACGSCWEAVIRIDERRSLVDQNTHRPDCITCGTHLTGATA